MSMKNANELKIGIFAVSGLLLLVFGWAYLREFSMSTQQKLTVVFDDVAGLIKGSFVRVNGLRVGRIDKLTLDTKENKVLADARIQIPNIKVPIDSRFYIRTSGYVGDKYLDIALGKSEEYLSDNAIIPGEPAVDAFKSLETVSKILEQINPELVGKNIEDFTSGAASFVKNADSVVSTLPKGDNLAKLVHGANETVNKLNVAIDKAEQLAVNESAQSNLTRLLEQAKSVSGDLNQTLVNANSLANNKTAFNNVNDLLIRASKIIEQLDEIKADPLIQNELRQTLTNANEAAKKLAVTSDEFSGALNQRFILPRLFFGKLVPKKDRKKDENK